MIGFPRKSKNQETITDDISKDFEVSLIGDPTARHDNNKLLSDCHFNNNIMIREGNDIGRKSQLLNIDDTDRSYELTRSPINAETKIVLNYGS